MRTTVRLDDALLAEAKRYAAESNQSLTAVIDTALRLMLARGKRPEVRVPVTLATTGGKGLKHGVDLDDSASLLDLMDNRG